MRPVAIAPRLLLACSLALGPLLAGERPGSSRPSLPRAAGIGVRGPHSRQLLVPVSAGVGNGGGWRGSSGSGVVLRGWERLPARGKSHSVFCLLFS